MKNKSTKYLLEKYVFGEDPDNVDAVGNELYRRGINPDDLVNYLRKIVDMLANVLDKKRGK